MSRGWGALWAFSQAPSSPHHSLSQNSSLERRLPGVPRARPVLLAAGPWSLGGGGALPPGFTC